MHPILFSVSYAGFWGQAKLTLEDFIPHAAKLGFAGVELMGKRPHLSPLDWPDARLDSLRDLCAKHRLAIACLAAYTHFTGGAEAAEVPFGEMQVQYVDSLCRMAARLGSPLVRVFTAYERADMPLAAQWARTVAGLRECAERAAGHGVMIGIQNHHDLAVHSKVLKELLADVNHPACKLMLDPWSPCLRGEELFETARGLAPDTVYTTLADYVRLPRFHYRPDLINYEKAEPDMVRAVPMGEGDLDSATFLRGLHAGGFNGPVAYEMCSPLRGGGSLENLDRCATAFLRWLEAAQASMRGAA
jgi:sugar phosphate isomerase/epimerase